ncbi:MAG: hypothetical protein AAB455_02020 [Patescibacteria group bacterium]
MKRPSPSQAGIIKVLLLVIIIVAILSYYQFDLRSIMAQLWAKIKIIIEGFLDQNQTTPTP